MRRLLQLLPLPLILALALTTAGMVPSGQELRDHVKKHGNVETLILKQYPPADLPTLVANAGLIGRAIVTEAKSFLSGDKVSTDYAVLVLTVVKGQREMEGKTITIRRPGGTVSIEGGTVTAHEPDFPPFQIGEEYVLFLTPAGEGRFTVPFGAQGAFTVDQGKVAQMLQDGTWNRERGAVPLLQFLEEIGAIKRQE